MSILIKVLIEALHNTFGGQWLFIRDYSIPADYVRDTLAGVVKAQTIKNIELRKRSSLHHIELGHHFVKHIRSLKSSECYLLLNAMTPHKYFIN